jgi:hypothetical protein
LPWKLKLATSLSSSPGTFRRETFMIICFRRQYPSPFRVCVSPHTCTFCQTYTFSQT